MVSFIRVRPTSEGIRLVLLIVLVGFAAFNTRNNLLFLMFAVGLAAVIVSLLVGSVSLRNISVAAERAADVYVGVPWGEELRLRNRSRLFDAYGVTVEDLDFPGPPPRAVVARIPRRGEAVAALTKTYSRRGVFLGRRLAVATGYPFGLFRVRRIVQVSRKLVVFPAVKRVDISFVFRGGLGPVPRRQRAGESEELFRIREYAFGDNVRHVDWKATAKLSTVMVREFASEQTRQFCIVLDNAARSQDETGADPLFETMVSAAASLASHLASHRFSFRFVSAEDTFPHGSSVEHLRGILAYLAGVRRQNRPGADLVQWVRDANRGEEVLLVLPGHPKSPLLSLASPSLHVINPGILVLEEGGRGA